MNLQELLQKVKDELRLRNYSRRTIESYLFCLKEYFKYIKIIKREPEIAAIKKYLKRCAKISVKLYLKNLKIVGIIDFFFTKVYPFSIRFFHTGFGIEG